MMITSRDNPVIRLMKRLLNDAAARREQGLFAIEGARLCQDAAESGVVVRTVLYTATAQKNYAASLRALQSTGAELVEISDALSGLIADTANPQGVFCLCEFLDNRAGLDTIRKSPSVKTGYLALENVQDPSNMGTVIRTAEALGLDGLLLSDGCCDRYNPKVLRGSMGGVFRLPMITVGNMTDAVRQWRDRGLDCFACVVEADAVPITRAGLSRGCICVIGNEGSGLRPETAAACTKRVTIPMAGRAESLNAAMAAGIVLWEMAKAAKS